MQLSNFSIGYEQTSRLALHKLLFAGIYRMWCVCLPNFIFVTPMVYRSSPLNRKPKEMSCLPLYNTTKLCCYFDRSCIYVLLFWQKLHIFPVILTEVAYISILHYCILFREPEVSVALTPPYCYWFLEMGRYGVQNNILLPFCPLV
jgi:hypothetical protein